MNYKKIISIILHKDFNNFLEITSENWSGKNI